MGKILDTLLTNVGKILDKSIKFTMFCVRVVGENNRGFSRVLSGFKGSSKADKGRLRGKNTSVLERLRRGKIEGKLEEK